MVTAKSIIPHFHGTANTPNRIELFDIAFDAVSFPEAIALLVQCARRDRPAYAVTANVDHVVRVHREPKLRRLYSCADLVVADGAPLIWASRMLGKPLPQRVAGSDLFPALCEQAAKSELSVFLLGGAPGSAEKAAAILLEKYPRLVVAGTCCPDFGFEHDPVEDAKIVERVRAARPDILFVGLGSPKQENWIVNHLTTCGARLSIGVGISFSFVSGDVVRAPRWVQKMGMEWLHRLCQEPRRLWKRYLVEDRLFFTMFLKTLIRGKRAGLPVTAKR